MSNPLVTKLAAVAQLPDEDRRAVEALCYNTRAQLVLADALGMTAVHINRVLKELRLSGAMALNRGKLTIMDPTKLVTIAGFDENYLHRRLRHAA